MKLFQFTKADDLPKILILCLCVLSELNEFVRCFQSGLVYSDHVLDSLSQWFVIEFSATGTRKVALIKPTNWTINLCAAFKATSLQQGGIQGTIGAQGADSIAEIGIEVLAQERLIRRVSEVIHQNVL
jgi:hypothetical protein